MCIEIADCKKQQGRTCKAPLANLKDNIFYYQAHIITLPAHTSRPAPQTLDCLLLAPKTTTHNLGLLSRINVRHIVR